MNEVVANCAVTIANMMVSICDKESLKNAKSFLDWKIKTDRNCAENETAIRELFAPALVCRTKAAFKACVETLRGEAVRVSAEYRAEIRAKQVIKRLAEEGLTATVEEVRETKTARENEVYSVSAAVAELKEERANRIARVILRLADEGLPDVTPAEVEATHAAKIAMRIDTLSAIHELLCIADGDPVKREGLRRYTTFVRSWYRQPETEEERAKYGDRVREAGEPDVIETGVHWGEARFQCWEHNVQIPEDDFYSVKMEFREE